MNLYPWFCKFCKLMYWLEEYKGPQFCPVHKFEMKAARIVKTDGTDHSNVQIDVGE